LIASSKEMNIETSLDVQQRFSLSAGIWYPLTACGLFRLSPITPPGIVSGTPLGDSRSVANGERIYFTAINDRDGTISYQGGPPFSGMMMGSYLTCAACHGPTAHGGKHIMHMDVMDAPDIRIIELSSEIAGYDLETFHKAVVDGKDEEGKALSQDMPRWQISDADLADLFTFLQGLP
jgi:Cytochrome c